jgi:hypothetical protein
MRATAGRPTPSRSATASALALPLLLAACAGAPPAPPPPPAPEPAAEVKPAYAMVDAGWKKASELEPGCVARTVLPPPGLKRLPEVTVKFAVAPDGAVDRFEDVSSPPAAPQVVAAVRRAVVKCDFVPGRDPTGKLAYTWMILTVSPR